MIFVWITAGLLFAVAVVAMLFALVAVTEPPRDAATTKEGR